MDAMILAVELNSIGKLIYNVLYGWVKSWGSDFALIGAFAITVILFTVFLKTALLPLDLWQKQMGRKNAKKMEMMKPEMDKVTKQCGDNRELLMQKQREIHKKYKYSAFSACLPALVTMVVFFVVFSGFNSAVKYHNYKTFEDLNEIRISVYQEEITALKGEADEPTEAQVAAAEKKAADAVLAAYKPEQFLLTTNIFMPDTWKQPIPTKEQFSGTGFGNLGITDVDGNDYDATMRPIIEKYNTNEKGKNVWNGYLILPILAFALSIISSKLIKQPEQPQMAGQSADQAKMAQSQAKMMTYMMPLMMGVFSLFYSTAFALYMVVSNLYSTVFSILFNVFSKKADAKEKDRILSTTLKK